MNKEPLVSIIMPAYNGEKYIGTAIERILEQTYSNIELMIVDDCSKVNIHSWVPQNKRNRHFQVIPINLHLEILIKIFQTTAYFLCCF